MTYLWIAIGGAIGGVARYWCDGLVSERLGAAFPWGTILVNVAGSFVIGVAAPLVSSFDRPWFSESEARAFLIVGLCGGYTTFSAFSIQSFVLLREGAWAHALGNVALSVASCLAAVWLGYLAGAGLDRIRPS